MDEKLWLDGIEIEIPQKTVKHTFQINDLGEIKDRQLNRTNRFRFYMTPANVKALDYLGISTNSLKPYRFTTARYSAQGIEIISNGKAIVKKTDQDARYYEIYIYSGNSSFYETLKGRRINQLNYEDLNHFLNTATYEASFANTEGYIYALGDFGDKSVSGVVDIDRQAPSVFVKTLWDKIFSGAGFTYEGAVFDTPDFITEVVTPTKGYTLDQTSLVETSLGTAQSGTIVVNEVSEDPIFSTDKFPLSSSGGLTNLTLSGDSITVDFTGILDLDLDIDYSLNTGYASFRVRRGTTTVIQKNLVTGSNQNLTIKNSISVTTGDVISFELYASTFEPSDPNLNIYQVNVDAVFTCAFKSIAGGALVDFSLIMPETSQIDFVKEVMVAYGLIFVETIEKHYKFIQIEELLNDRANAEDWSDKLVSKGAETYSVGSYAKENYLTYRYLENFAPSHDGNLEIDNESLNPERTLYGSIFTISEQSLIKNTQPIYRVPIWEVVEENSVNVIKNVETPFRKFRIDKVNGTVNVQISWVAGSTAISTDIPYISLNNIGFDYYLANNYPAFKSLLDRQKKRGVPVELNLNDIKTLDFFKLKFFSQLGQYFYLNKIRSYDSNKRKVIAELIQVNELTVNQPPSQLGLVSKSFSHGGNRVLMLSDFLNSTPPYADPEFDQPEIIKLTGGFNSEVIIKNNGVTITSETDIEIATMNLVLEDIGAVVTAKEENFTYKIKSFNSNDFSTVEGTIKAVVSAETQLPPVTDAGADLFITFDSGSNNFSGSAFANGCNSNDPNGGVLTYLWEVIGIVNQATVNIANPNSCGTNINLTNISPLGSFTFTLRLTVTDSTNLSSSDTITANVVDLTDNPA